MGRVKVILGKTSYLTDCYRRPSLLRMDVEGKPWHSLLFVFPLFFFLFLCCCCCFCCFLEGGIY